MSHKIGHILFYLFWSKGKYHIIAFRSSIYGILFGSCRALSVVPQVDARQSDTTHDKATRRTTKRHDARQSDTTDDKATRRNVVMSCRFVAMSCRFVVRRLSTGVEVAFYHRHRDGVFGSVVNTLCLFPSLMPKSLEFQYMSSLNYNKFLINHPSCSPF